jgi:hypothetical protein
MVVAKSWHIFLDSATNSCMEIGCRKFRDTLLQRKPVSKIAVCSIEITRIPVGSIDVVLGLSFPQVTREPIKGAAVPAWEAWILKPGYPSALIPNAVASRRQPLVGANNDPRRSGMIGMRHIDHGRTPN